MPINPKKQDECSDKISAPKQEYKLKEMQDAIDNLCLELSKESCRFKEYKFIKELIDYINEYERLLYVNVTNYVCRLDEKSFASMQSNIDFVAHYIYSKNFENDFRNEDKLKRDAVKKIVLKLWDHINLARKQFELFAINENKYGEIAKKKVEDSIPNLTKEMNMKLISLVSIFTALSFLLFGGLSSLDNILDGAKDIPILKLLITGDIWCLCMMNLIFVFMFFVSKLTKLNIKSAEDVNANFIQKYPFIWWSNWVLCSSGIIFGWIYYLKRRQLLCEIENGFFNNSKAFVFIVSGTIIVAILITGIYILINNGKVKKKKKP